MQHEDRMAFLRLLEEGRKRKGESSVPAFLDTNGWRFGVSLVPFSRAAIHLSASLQRGPIDRDASYLAEVLALFEVPDVALLTPYDALREGEVLHWQWGGSEASFEAAKHVLPRVQQDVKDFFGKAQHVRVPGRNDPCFCGSGKKYKHCCIRKPIHAGPCDVFVPERDGACGLPSSGVIECSICGKRYPRCDAHHADAQQMARGHLLRVHAETLPEERVLALADDPQAMAFLEAQRARAPELWATFFAHVEALRKKNAS